MNTDIPTSGEMSSLLRVDCRMRAQPFCSGRCVWRQEGDTLEKGKCYLHVSENVSLGEKDVNGPRLLFLRLIEELLRFPERRRQLLYEDVPTLVSIKEAIRMGDQWIIPETSVAWYDLLRLDWVKTGKERKIFFEEMSRKEGDESLKQIAPTVSKPTLPEPLTELFGADDPKLSALQLYKVETQDEASPLRPYLALLGYTPVDIGLEESAPALTKEAIKKLVVLSRIPILQFNLEAAPPDDSYAYGLFGRQKSEVPYIFIITDEGPSLLSLSSTQLEIVRPEAMPSELFDIYEGRVSLRIK